MVTNKSQTEARTFIEGKTGVRRREAICSMSNSLFLLYNGKLASAFSYRLLSLNGTIFASGEIPKMFSITVLELPRYSNWGRVASLDLHKN